MPLDISRIRAELPGRHIHYFASTTTTMAEAAKLAAVGAPAGTLVLADQQTAGRGRLGRAWYSEADAGLYFTLILRPTRTVPWLTLSIGLALHKAITTLVGGEANGARADIRWPNDVLLNGLKCAGILVTADGDSVLVGIGVNANHGDFPPELAGLATSLRIVTGQLHSREDLLVTLVGYIDRYLVLPVEEIRSQFHKASTYAEGRRVEIEDTGQQGVTKGLDLEGYLLLRRDDGVVERIVSGGVRPARA